MYGSAAYRSAAAHSGVELSPQRKVALLLGGSIDRIRLAETQIATGQQQAKLATIDNVMQILETLRASLNHDDGGAIADQLSSIYMTAEAQLVEANARNDVAKLQSVARLLEPIRDAFAELANSTATDDGSPSDRA